MVRGVSHAEYIKAHPDEKGGSNITSSKSPPASAAHLSPNSSNTPPALISGQSGRASKSPPCAAVPYVLPERKYSYAGSVLCLARTEYPDTSSFDAPEIVHRMTEAPPRRTDRPVA